MRLGKDLENKPIISVTDGRMLGRTKDLYLNSELTEVAGLFVGTEGVIRRTERIIPTDRVVLYGIDVILVEDPEVVTTTKAMPASDKWHRLSHLHGREAQTPGGTKLATLDDIMLDEQGAVSGFSLSRVFVTGPLAENPFIPRTVVVDPFQRGDVLLVDFPQLEALFADVDEEEPVPEKPVPEEVSDGGNGVDSEPEPPSKEE